MKSDNELHREFMGVSGLDPFNGTISSARKAMFATHMSQCLVFNHSTPRRIQTGMEQEYGKYTFSVKMPVDGQIIKIIERYRPKIGEGAIAFSPQSIVIYEDEQTKEVGMINIPRYCSYHQYFGFEYQRRPGADEIRVGASIKAGTIFTDSPSIDDAGNYKYGRNLNVAYMSHPAVSEDGIMISRDVLPLLSFKTYETRIVEWGNKRMPLNLYGDVNNFKPFPDIGEYVRSDGLLMCLRNYDKDLAVVDQSIYDLMEIDHIFDKGTYTSSGGRIIDIRVHHDNMGQSEELTGMDGQAVKYDRARREFYQELLTEYHRLRRLRGDALRLTPELHRLIVEAMAVLDDDPQRVQKLYRRNTLDTWRVEFVIEYVITPTIGFKLTDTFGGKGVICKIVEPHHMPIDAAGNRADIVMDGNSTMNRMNVGRSYEQYITASARDTTLKIACDLGIVDNKARDLPKQLEAMEATNPALIDKVWQYLMGFYSIVTPKTALWFRDGEYKEKRTTHLAHVVKDGIFMYKPPDDDPEFETIVQELERHYRPVYGPVTYTGNSGIPCRTVMPVRIGEVYFILLEKIADDWAAISSGKWQHFGVLSQMTNVDKYAQPYRGQAVRAWGESEIRIAISYAGGKVTADILDRNNNPITHKHILNSILTADKPTNIYSAVDRNVVPLGGARPLQLAKHILQCSGLEFEYSNFIPTSRAPMAVH